MSDVVILGGALVLAVLCGGAPIVLSRFLLEENRGGSQ